jgi:hypothetical protein
MGTWDRIRAALRREKRELDDVVKDATAKADTALTKREHDLTATPAEKLAMEQERAAENDAEFEALRQRIEGKGTSST